MRWSWPRAARPAIWQACSRRSARWGSKRFGWCSARRWSASFGTWSSPARRLACAAAGGGRPADSGSGGLRLQELSHASGLDRRVPLVVERRELATTARHVAPVHELLPRREDARRLVGGAERGDCSIEVL